MTTINASRKVQAPLDRVWEIIADVDSEPKYYPGLNSVRNISTNGNVIEREVTVGFRNSHGKQTVMLNPKRSVEVIMREGVMTGKRTVTLTPLDGGTATKIDISWDIEVPGVPVLFRGNVKNNIAKGTEEALERIARATQ
ncbi:oligoketide cyclase/lipid transport protein [Candidatus Nitrososphaera evergladensis SR1]|uniref:Oligoketide cyclase/lipid transport protein n=1 Tax=Candidatus Nitrososphaera evergladensis SR1 TaxID=1459636 RepID=A0A075MY53_9ARCH|nr:SRPBCC family protein [Candidatus Nitrososphaera evergladensis]AIF84204.1 oligoketide cyclase/lipid transport protein [Candidatus Nitrososphaera evergladensis SR1]